MARSKKPDLPTDKFEGRLRSICRGSPRVNAARAEYAGNVRVSDQRILSQVSSLGMGQRHSSSVAFTSMVQPALKVFEKPTKDDASRTEIEIQTFGYLKDENAEFDHPALTSRRGRVVTLRGSPSDLSSAAEDEALIRVQIANTLKHPTAARNGITADAQHISLGDEIDRATLTGGENVLVGIIDVDGYDFAHEDFLDDDGKTRFVGIWDQGGDIFDSPAGFDYGSFLSAAHLDQAMQTASGSQFSATDIMPQSQMRRGSHGTHVASIAAGNHSLADRSLIAGVLISIPAEEQDSRLSFYDTTRIVHAVEFLFSLADQLRAQGRQIDGVSINISLGTNGGPHDNSAPMTRWIDNALTRPGVCVSVAAGNSGQEAPQHARDIGHMMGRIHAQGRIASTGLVHELEWVVVGDGIKDVSENEMEIWYAPQDRLFVQLRPPGEDWLPVVEPSNPIQNEQIGDMTFVSIFNELYDAANGYNRIGIYLSPNFATDTIIGLRSGTWGVRLIGDEIRDGRYHAWIERDDPVHIGEIDSASIWRFPSFFAEGSFVDESSISTLACGDRILAVANQDAQRQVVNITSSQGPTRDGREKPDIAAPGTDIVAANGFDPQAKWVAMSGTSMASPLVAGLSAAMISIHPSLTSSQILGILRRTAIPLPGRGYEWQNDAGFGALNIAACLKEAQELAALRDRGGA